MKLIYYSKLSLFFSLILENPDTFFLTVRDFKTLSGGTQAHNMNVINVHGEKVKIMLMCLQSLLLSHYLESAPSQVLLL